MSEQGRLEPGDITLRLLRIRLADGIRRRREARGMTQQELANAAFVQRTVIANIETARSSTQLIVLYRIALALRCETSDLLPSALVIAPHWRAVRPPRPLTGRKRRARA